MHDLSLVLLCAGDATRFKAPIKKQWLRFGELPLWLFVAKEFEKIYKFKEIIIVAKDSDISYMQKIAPNFKYVKGGNLRQISLKNALDMVDSEFVMVSDAARAKVSKENINKLFENLTDCDCISPYTSISDTAYLGESLVDRNEIKLIQTPQISRVSLLKAALLKDEIFTDDSSAIKSVGGKLKFVEIKDDMKKITKIEDLKFFDFQSASSDILVGNGFDVHALRSGEYITLCGVKILCEYALIAHSDGDAGIHALIDAICGASMLGDIGELFPDNDERYKNIDSKILLKEIVKRINSYGFIIKNADITIIAQRPKLSEYKDKMREVISEILGTKFVNIKATTTEKLGFTGRSEGIACIASVTLGYFDWKKL
ncbi:MAG: bifunctional 2-C-methyl-D-erythritol 4-phosphate cytidylyltransferase/2-C-methyl-D-erythritol 2,4-cyclodiphosphate synthase [Campylobacter sp.]|nr:bifunctional 2-C-methyl-D-erythritol 4-phosphate cytidylyltransferase/2-C-methyl-D-erythritol 2,4-cyclodiphosphate synthase [Campylobacter sp.]